MCTLLMHGKEHGDACVRACMFEKVQTLSAQVSWLQNVDTLWLSS